MCVSDCYRVNEDSIAKALQMQKTTVRKLLQVLYKDLLVLTYVLTRDGTEECYAG